MRAVLAAGMMLIVALAGCSGGGEPTAGTDVATDEPPSEEKVDTEAGKVAANKGIVFGRVHDDFNFSLKGAYVSVVGTTLFAETNATGHYRIADVGVGTVEVRVEMTDFRVGQQQVKISSGKAIRLDFELKPLIERSGGMAPHRHDFWGDATERIIMDHDLSVNTELTGGGGAVRGSTIGPVAAVQCGIERCRWEFTLPDQSDGKPASIWPGTKEITATLSWSGTTMQIASAEIEWSPPVPERDGIHTGLGNGDSFTIPVAPDEQDHGHALYTGWRFFLNTRNSVASAEPGMVSGSFHITMELVKGELVLDPPHEDHWKGASSLPIANWDWRYNANTGVLPTAADGTDANHVFRLSPCSKGDDGEYKCVNIIPPGATRLQVYFEWISGSNLGGVDAPFSYSLTYRTADQHPEQTPLSDYKTPVLVEEDLDKHWRLYEIDVAGHETDAFYMQRSTWGWKWYQDSDLDYNVLQGAQKFYIHVTAYR